LHEIELNIVNNINVIDYIINYKNKPTEGVEGYGYKLISQAETTRKKIRSDQKREQQIREKEALTKII